MSSPSRIDFSPEDEKKMVSAALWGKIIAIASIAGAALDLLLLILSGEGAAAGIGAVVIQSLLGTLLLLASRAFERVATTDEDDHGHLLAGFRHLRAYFMTQSILIILLFVAMIAMAVLGAAMMSALSF